MQKKQVEKSESVQENIIEVDGLCKSFGQITAVDNLSFCVKRGSFLAFLGVNGAGKSTTINIICSILKKDSGKIVVDGMDSETDSNAIKRKIGIVFQSSVLDKQLTVKQNLCSRAALYGLSKKETAARVGALAEVFDLTQLLPRSLDTLSGGQRRRVDIARALIHEPQILILDEPTTGLDPNTRIKIWQEVESLKKSRGLTVFLTTHYMEEAARADDVIILDNGKIAAQGSPDALKNKYATDYIRVVCPKDEKTEKALGLAGGRLDYKNNSYYIPVKNSRDALEFINAHHDIICDFEVLKGDMDDVFLTVTGKKLGVPNEN